MTSRYVIERWAHRDGIPRWDYLGVEGPIEGRALAVDRLSTLAVLPTVALRLIARESDGRLYTVAARFGRLFGRRLPDYFGADVAALLPPAAVSCVVCGDTGRISDDVPCSCAASPV